MTMKSPLHPGCIVQMAIEGLNRSVSEVASEPGISRQQLYNVMNGKSAVTPEMAIRLEQSFGSAADTWLRMQAAYDLAKVRELASGIRIERLVPKDTAAD